jgi:flagellar biosynthesis protein FlhB
MNDDAAEKPFEATPQRIEKAKREGNVARSGELGANLAFAGAACAVVAIVPTLGALARSAIVAAATATGLPVRAAWATVVLALAPVASAAIAGIAASLLQSGGLQISGVGAKMERLNPVDGIKRMCSRDTLAHGWRAAAAFGVAIMAMAPAFVAAASEMVRAPTITAVADAVWHAVERVAFAACGTGVLFALAEYGAARTAWLRKLRMSFDERKRETKEHDGDPFTRGRRRMFHRALLRGALAKVKDASFVVANPTHFAVALEYRPPEIPIPLVLVRAAGEAALRVRALATTHDVPVVENVTLAQALYRDGRAGQPIAQAHYVAVAEIVAALARAKAVDS